MAKLTKTAFYLKWASLFADNKTGLISESRMRQFAQDCKDSFAFDNLVLPELPPNVEWVLVPGITIVGQTATESAASIKVDGILKPIPQQDINIPFAGAGKKRLDVIVLDYLAAVPSYIRIPGKEVGIYESAGRETIPANYLFVNDVEVTDGAVKPSAAGAIKFITVNGGARVPADAAGVAALLFEGGHIILGPDGSEAPTAARLQFTAGDGVEINLANPAGITVVDISVPELVTLSQAMADAYELITLAQEAADTGKAMAQQALDRLPLVEHLFAEFRFDEIDIDDAERVDFTRKIEIINAVTTGEIASVSYRIGATGTNGITAATVTDLNTWINANVSTGVKYFIEVLQVAAAAGIGYGQHTLRYWNR